ncbi:ABC transporter substrate-binding protein [Ferribacterium limneticum]|uniref:ABC transporter substrate-binding protein n=1 Tax=Ferribacterium limneticum TaxID=76259 RepID=UPI001CF9321A|nr:ABC transporter substrate-binding protein [Ferribacterium limneticum]UCV27494.1 ABC transporter substrate-binding protein [Ferribacterium limneticum]UCV31411.1 ABC transporter substrate-binding protein [Ferribacterium limneticum]
MKSLHKVLLAGLLALGLNLAHAEVGVTDSSITLGMSAPFTGPNGLYGMQMREAMLAHFDQVNKSGGVNGRKVELITIDDGYETERTLSNTKTLIQEKQVFALMGYYGSTPTTEAMNKVFGPAKVPLVGTISGAGTLREPQSTNPNSRYMFNIRASYADEAEAIVNQIIALGLKNIAVLYQNDGFGKSGLEGVTNALKRANLAPVAVGTVERNSLDVAKATEAISKVNPQAVVMVTLYKPTAAFVKAMKQLGQFPMFLTLSPVGAEVLAQELGNDARGIGISQVVPYPWNDTIGIVRDYQRLLDKQKDKFSYYGLEGYITARLMTEALKKLGKDVSREKLVTTLEGMQNFDLGGFKVNYGANNRLGSRYVELTVVGAGGKVIK